MPTDPNLREDVTPATITLRCTPCSEDVTYPNKGLGRASAAAWKSRHQHPSSDPYEDYRDQWVQTCETVGLLYREADAEKFARDCGWDGVTR